MKEVRVAIIGHGHLGKWHAEKAENLHDSRLMAIVELNEKSHQSIKEKYPEVLVTSSLDEALPLFDAAVISTPTSTHAKVISFLLKAKKHIFCEKPLCSDEREAGEILRIKKEYSPETVFQVGHSERYHEVWGEIGKELGETENALIQIQRTSSFKGRATDVDVVQDLMIHDIDLLFYLLKTEIKDVQGIGVKNLSNYWDDVGVYLSLERGNQAWLRASRNSCQELRNISISDSRGEIFVDLMNLTYEKKNPQGESVLKGEYDKRDHLKEEQKAFYKAILNRQGVPVSLEDGVKAIGGISKILEKIKEKP